MVSRTNPVNRKLLKVLENVEILYLIVLTL